MPQRMRRDRLFYAGPLAGLLARLLHRVCRNGPALEQPVAWTHQYMRRMPNNRGVSMTYRTLASFPWATRIAMRLFSSVNTKSAKIQLLWMSEWRKTSNGNGFQRI